ncbi:hypothetical protein [Polaribacter sp. Hel1_85]|uniref:hypothetical protein n=1 Tax=Polaribacter sp. Hel1_85 TaxID=1250005 RepID=UPI00052BAADB|nr:hypothetical protein [Polaribacter sp. Hel1_85]KGL63155.1 hypothetical protein PHEL85_0188 [Polaribacter sp. Hel1_85]
MKKLVFILFFTCILLQKCTKEDCNSLCFTPPNQFNFEFVDAKTGENIFTSNSFDKNELNVINLENNSIVEFTFIDENDYNILSINSIGWKTESVNYSIQIANKEILNLYVEAKRLSENCCSFTRFETIKINNTNYTLDNQSGIYTILLE